MTNRNSLRSEPTKSVIERLYEAARQDRFRFLKLLPRLVMGFIQRKTFSQSLTPESMKDCYIPVSREQGEFLYVTARALGAKNVVEFGTSFGISTIYLASAVRDNGSGIVIGSEIETSKCTQASRNIDEAGLSKFAEVRVGDALETLRKVPEPVDLILLDGWKDLYLPVIKLLQPRLKTGSVILADNIFTFRKGLRPYVEYMQSGENRFISTTIPLGEGFEYSVYIG
ncbi:MAG: class I SAM-dependent methyltransferase [Deltaproteobacteria bacterium]|nr:class I SAM-dependent methyltransferase [Deltaproteobacteria bacterium]